MKEQPIMIKDGRTGKEIFLCEEGIKMLHKIITKLINEIDSGEYTYNNKKDIK